MICPIFFGANPPPSTILKVERLQQPWDAARVGAATGQPAAMEKTRAATNATWHWG